MIFVFFVFHSLGRRLVLTVIMLAHFFSYFLNISKLKPKSIKIRSLESIFHFNRAPIRGLQPMKVSLKFLLVFVRSVCRRKCFILRPSQVRSKLPQDVNGEEENYDDTYFDSHRDFMRLNKWTITSSHLRRFFLYFYCILLMRSRSKEPEKSIRIRLKVEP